MTGASQPQPGKISSAKLPATHTPQITTKQWNRKQPQKLNNVHKNPYASWCPTRLIGKMIIRNHTIIGGPQGHTPPSWPSTRLRTSSRWQTIQAGWSSMIQGVEGGRLREDSTIGLMRWSMECGVYLECHRWSQPDNNGVDAPYWQLCSVYLAALFFMRLL